jgi:hypothetical protein
MGPRTIPREWIFSHRCSWITVYVFVVMPRVSLIVILVMYVRYLYSINCPTVICLPSMLYLSYGETPQVNCGPRSNFLYIVTAFYFTRTIYFYLDTIILLPLDTLNPLFTAKQ